MLNLLLTVAAQGAEHAAEVASTNASPWIPLAAIGAGLAVIGGGMGIGKIGAAGNDAIARQPEAAADIRGNALILSALIEGATFFGIVVGLLIALKQV
ncbi:MAG: ATP synthase F0 subunit C [Planctomycetes bacterium]|nr:ATP synthase F0 subunit C [Planctomycetota bacterium]MBL7008958.1 ATP synthase F0 subunit C [Planctomycetota bacterium]